jgi:hypothetical protein
MRCLIITIIYLVGSSFVFGQCPTDDIFFTTQKSIDNFGTHYPSCTAVRNISIKGANITDLSGLRNVSTIYGTLHIYENPLLETLHGLESITEVTSTLWIHDNAKLKNLNGLAGVETVGSVLNVSGNPALTSITGLSKLEFVGGNFDIRFNDLLPSFEGLEGLQYVGGFLTIGGASLASISSLNNLTSVTGEITVNFTALTSLAGLGHIDPAGITRVEIQNSGNLRVCEVASICGYLTSDANPATIFNNGAGCDDRLEVSFACEQISPAERIFLNYKLANGIVLLDWATASKINKAGFEVQYSKNGLRWQRIGFVDGHATTTETNHYEFAHDGFSGGANYYRLKQWDLSGDYRLSNVINVSLSSQWKRDEWILYPNPTSGQLTVNGDFTNLPLVRIINSSGIMIREFILRERSIDITDLPVGMYYLTIYNERGRFTRRIIKAGR